MYDLLNSVPGEQLHLAEYQPDLQGHFWRIGEAGLLGSQTEPSNRTGPKDALKKKLTDATTPLHSLQAAIEAGADPVALVDAINTAQAERAAAQAELDGTPEARNLKGGEVYAMIDSLGDVGTALADGRPETLNKIYDSLQLRLKYEPHARVVEATISPRVVSMRVRGASCALTTRLSLVVAE
ncbi:hypothetical protein [Saccharopolyspora sp. NPDC002578]